MAWKGTWKKPLAYLPTLPVFPGVSKFFIKSPGLPVKPPNLPGTTYRGFFLIFFFTNFVIFAISKEKIKREVYLVLLFTAFIWSENVNQREQSNLHIFNKHRNWSEITHHIAQYIVENWRGFRTPFTSDLSKRRWPTWISIHFKRNS